MKGIDVAKWNGVIDWQKVKANGVEFAILKAIKKGGDTEESFERNYKGAKEAKIPVGVYNYSYATTVIEAEREAMRVLQALAYRPAPMKVWLDVEDKCTEGLGKILIDMIMAYKAVIEKYGLKFGVYTGLSYYKDNIMPYGLDNRIPFWIARYPANIRMKLSDNPNEAKKPGIMHPLWGWQYTSTGMIDGIKGNVDISQLYDNNVQGPPKTVTDEKKTTAEIVQEVINGKWGDGEARKDRLTAAGYDYEAIRRRVNAIYRR